MKNSKKVKSPKLPKYRKQNKSSGAIAFVELNGQRFYLGKYGSPESETQYHRLLAEWKESEHQLPVQHVASVGKSNEITVVELCARFWAYAKKHYAKPDGSASGELLPLKSAIGPLKKLYPHLFVGEFGPLKLKVVRQQMIDKGWSRKNINRMVARVKMIFRWGVENELVPATVPMALDAMRGLQRGRSEAAESEPVTPVPMDNINAIKPYVSRQVWALIQLQLRTAARGGELVMLRPIDIDMSKPVWTCDLKEHKTAHRGHDRVIYIGPKAQNIINDFINNRPLDAYLFNPQEAAAERAAKAQTHRRAKQKPDKRKTGRKVSDHYVSGSYRRAIQRACIKAKVPSWHPHQLRHNAGTFIRQEYGLEAARVMLGHSKVDTTQIYAEENREKALQIAEKIG